MSKLSRKEQQLLRLQKYRLQTLFDYNTTDYTCIGYTFLAYQEKFGKVTRRLNAWSSAKLTADEYILVMQLLMATEDCHESLKILGHLVLSYRDNQVSWEEIQRQAPFFIKQVDDYIEVVGKLNPPVRSATN